MNHGQVLYYHSTLGEMLQPLPICATDNSSIYLSHTESAQCRPLMSIAKYNAPSDLPMEPQWCWVDAFHVMWNRQIDEIVDFGQYNEAESTQLRRLLDKHIRLFDRDVTSSLLHMDCAGDNILVDTDSRVTGLIDWERSLSGDPEMEFALLDSWGIAKPAFWEGYGSAPNRSAGHPAHNTAGHEHHSPTPVYPQPPLARWPSCPAKRYVT
ncbi:MAG: phosphotransferase [Candidatus Latescibacteria bacterium]|nr:phosphotransferase [Candidatus Latescibacterota bacterium]